MNWVGTSPAARTGFEQFVLEHFGFYIDLSSNLSFAAFGLALLMVPFFFAGWSRIQGR